MNKELLKSKTGRILVESHRGAEGLAPENSWKALEIGSGTGADFLEMDVQLSQDGVAFLHHNYTLPDGRLCAGVPWDDIKNITIQGEPIPLLEEVLAWAREKLVYLSLDLKVGFQPEGRLTRAVLDLLERTHTREQVMLICWDHLELLQIKRSNPRLTTRALLRGRVVDFPEFLARSRVDAISLTYGVARPVDVQQAHLAGVAVMLAEMWQPDFETAKELDVDIISWSDPNQARKLLGITN